MTSADKKIDSVGQTVFRRGRDRMGTRNMTITIIYYPISGVSGLPRLSSICKGAAPTYYFIKLSRDFVIYIYNNTKGH